MYFCKIENVLTKKFINEALVPPPQSSHSKFAVVTIEKKPIRQAGPNCCILYHSWGIMGRIIKLWWQLHYN